MPEKNHPELNDLTGEVDVVVATIDEAYEQMKTVGTKQDVIFTADRSHVLTGEIYDLQQS